MSVRRWLGRAVNVTQVSTVTIANTWAAGDDAILTINGNDLVVTVGATDTATTDVAQALTDAINASSKLDGTGNTDATSNVGGQEIPELTEVTAAVSGSTVIITARTAGKPFTITASEDTAGDGTCTIASTVAATGKHFFDNVDNWSGGAVPVDADDIVFDFGNVDCKYGLPVDATDINPASITVTMDYTGKIGLPEINRDSNSASSQYVEYRARAPIFDYNNSTSTVLNIGGGSGSGSPMMNFEFLGDCLTVVTVTGTGQPQTGVSNYALNIWGPNNASAMTLNVQKGSVAIAPSPGQTASIAAINMGWVASQENDAKVFVGSGATLGSTAIVVDGGELILEATPSVTTPTIVQTGGKIYSSLPSGETVTSVTVTGGVFYADGGATITTLSVGSTGVFDCRRTANAITVSNALLYRGASVHDPRRRVTWTNGLDLIRCSPLELTKFDIGTHVTLTPSNV